MGEHQPFIFQRTSTEIQQQSTGEAGDFKIIDRLSFLDPRESAKGFDFYQHLVKANEVRTVTGGKLLSFVKDGKRYLALEGDLPRTQLSRERVLIHRFEKTEPKFPMCLHGRADNGISLFVGFL